MNKFEERLHVADGTYSEQQRELRSGRKAWVVLSGKICSGKDTAAARLNLPGNSLTIVSYGDILRVQLDSAINQLNASRKNGDSIIEQVEILQESLKLSEDHAADLLGMLLHDLEKKPDLNPWSRTDNMRVMLQNLGSIWLPNPDHLPASAAPRVMSLISGGGSAVSAGSRFLPDVEIPSLAGAITVRLDVTRETQLRRLNKRDGLEITPSLLASLDHPGETELDDYPFDIRVSNNDDDEGSLKALMLKINNHVQTILDERGSFDEDFGSITNMGNKSVRVNG